MEIIDFHNHHIPSRFQEAVVRAAPPHQRARWQALARKLTDRDLLHKDIREGHLNARVVNMSPALFADQDGRVPHATIMALNDDLAELVSRHPDQVFMDTNIAHPALLRAAVDLLGVGNVIAGSDWPINDDPMRRVLVDAMRRAGLSETEQQAIAATNCRRLLGLGGPAQP